MYIYKTTNLINGKIYIGQHYGIRKNYLGSGTLLLKSIKEYGRENFSNEILEYCEKLEHLDDREKFWIKELDSTNPDIGYNIAIGGTGIDTKIANKILTGRKLSETHKENICKAHADVSGEKNPMYGKKHTEETILKIKQKNKEWYENVGYSEEQIINMKIRSKGRNNSNYNPTSILQYDMNDIFIEEWKDLLSLKENGFNSKLISRVCRGQRKTAFGFKWKFKDD